MFLPSMLHKLMGPEMHHRLEDTCLKHLVEAIRMQDKVDCRTIQLVSFILAVKLMNGAVVPNQAALDILVKARGTLPKFQLIQIFLQGIL